MPGTFSAVPVMATGDWVTPGWVNTYVGGNMSAIWVGSAVGDMEYYLSATEKARLAKPSVDSLLKNTNAGAVSWLAINAIPKILHAEAAVYFDAGGQSTTSTSFVDVTNGTVNIVTTQTCTIRMFGMGAIANGTAGFATRVRGSIGGTVDPNSDASMPHTTGGNYVPFAYVYKRAGVGAGTITCKLQFKRDSGGTAFFNSGRIIVEAFAE